VHLAFTRFLEVQFIIAAAVFHLYNISFNIWTEKLHPAWQQDRNLLFTSWLKVLQGWWTIEQHMLASLEKDLMIFTYHSSTAGNFCLPKTPSPQNPKYCAYVLSVSSSNISLTANAA